MPQDPTTWVHPSWSLLWSVRPLDVDPGEIDWVFSAFSEFVAENMGIFSSTDGSEWIFPNMRRFARNGHFFSGRITSSCMIFVEHPIFRQKPCARDEGATDGGWNTGT